MNSAVGNKIFQDVNSSRPSDGIYASVNRAINGSGNPLAHYLNQCWIIVNYTLRDMFQWN